MKVDTPAITCQAHIPHHGLQSVHVQICCAKSVSGEEAANMLLLLLLCFLLLLLLLLLSGCIFSGCMHDQHAAQQDIWSFPHLHQAAFNAKQVETTGHCR